jgi:MYXO-CTERM domain-containing protein
MLSPAHAPRQSLLAVQRWLVPAALMTLSGAVLFGSFLKSDLTRNDFERFDDPRLLFLFFALFAGFSWAYVTAYLQRPPFSLRAIAATALVSSLLLLASFPVGSKDIFNYSFFGKLWGLYHSSPYVVTLADVPADPWQPYVQTRWRSLPALYGPLFLWQARAIYAVSGERLWVAVWLHKGAATLLLLATLWLARVILRNTTPDSSRGSWLLVLLAWNPLFLFESAGGGHNDIAMVLLLLGALEGWRRRRFTLAFGLLTLSIWYKWYSLIFVPAFLLETFKVEGWRTAARQAAWWLAATLLAGVIFLSPLPGSWPAVLRPLTQPAPMSGIYPAELSPPLAVLFWSLKAFGLFGTTWGLRLFDATRFALFVIAVALIFVRQWRAVPSTARSPEYQAPLAALVESCCLLSCAFFLLLITMLLPWHLLTVVASAVLCAREPFLGLAAVLTVLALLSYFVTFAGAAVLMGLVLGAFWLMERLRQGRPSERTF